MIACIIVDHRSKSVDKKFDYKIPDELEGQICIGSRVIVPFSRGNTEMEGFCVGLKEKSGAKNLKSILRPAPQPRAFDEKMLEIIEWMREKYLVSYLDAVHAVVPAGSAVKASEWLFLSAPSPSASEIINRIQQTIADNGGSMELDALETVFEKNVRPQIRSMIKSGVLTKEYRMSSAVNAKTRKYARLIVDGAEALEAAERLAAKVPSQAKALEILVSEGIAPVSELGRTSVQALVKKGLAEIFDQETERDPLSGKDIKKTESPELTYEQKAAVGKISHALDSGARSTFLLHGVTGSGKTEVFMRAIELVSAAGKSSLVLVPEISLTPQMVSRFASRFGERIAVLHSALSPGERYDQWKRIAEGRADIVIGARSAVFAPLKNIGIIIIDEEHSETYKSEMLPRYHAREVALKRAEQYGAAVVLASATPSVESMYRARRGEYELITMTKRYNENIMPEISVVDMREELKNGNRSMFSVMLREEIENNLKNGEQTILFLNRRGFSTFVSCRACGYTAKCPNCNISLTYHRYDDTLKCHYCGYEHKNYRTCPSCGSRYIRYFGGGTQKVEAEIRNAFPDASVLRMDVDTTGKKQSHEKLIERFEREKTDILIGTQMVAKGLDFENVTLVGVISADTMLHIDDFRSAERTFAMLEQVSGRAGRGKKTGRAVIQTYSPESEAVSLVKTHDYNAFYEAEIVQRKLMWYPPYSDIVCVMFSGVSASLVSRAARFFLKRLGPVGEWGQKAQVLGPVPAAVSKINNKYRYRLIIKCENADLLNERLSDAERECRRNKNYGAASIVTDKNPNMMY